MGNYQLGEIFACAKMCENLQKFASLQNWSQRFKEDNYQIVQNFCMCKKILQLSKIVLWKKQLLKIDSYQYVQLSDWISVVNF